MPKVECTVRVSLCHANGNTIPASRKNSTRMGQKHSKASKSRNPVLERADVEDAVNFTVDSRTVRSYFEPCWLSVGRYIAC